MAFSGYYIKIGTCEFRSPALSKDNFKVAPKLIQVESADRVGSGKIAIKLLPHAPVKLWIDFPPMTPTQFRTYFTALDSMSLSVNYYDETSDSYKTDTFYHTDFVYYPIMLNGERYIKFESFELIGY